MTIQSYTFNPFQTNTFIIYDGNDAVIVDASPHVEAEFEMITKFVDDNELNVRHLLLTHAHLDHIMGCSYLSTHFGLPWKLNSADKPFIDRAQDQARMFGMDLAEGVIETTPLVEGDTIEFGDVKWDVIETPGHSPGSVSFIDRANEFVVAGDVLFNGSIGRTDLLLGSLPTLMRSIFSKLMILEDHYKVLCGHGPETTIGNERATNPFLQDR